MQAGAPITAASPVGTPLILSVLSLMVSLVVGGGAVLMARANLQRQIRAASREAWMRDIEKAKRQAEIDATLVPAQQATILLIAEIELAAGDFIDALGRFLGAR